MSVRVLALRVGLLAGCFFVFGFGSLFACGIVGESATNEEGSAIYGSNCLYSTGRFINVCSGFCAMGDSGMGQQDESDFTFGNCHSLGDNNGTCGCGGYFDEIDNTLDCFGGS